MLLDDFCTALASCANRITWHPWTPEIRGHLRLGPNHALIECCPLTAVAYVQTGMPFSIDEPLIAAAEIGLSADDAQDVVFAADRYSLGDSPVLRARLRACVGLSVEEVPL